METRELVQEIIRLYDLEGSKLERFNREVAKQCSHHISRPKYDPCLFANWQCTHPENHTDDGDGHCSFATCPFNV